MIRLDFGPVRRIAVRMKTGVPHRDRREALRRLCVRATELLEDMHEPVMRGQAADASATRYRSIARGLKKTARDLASIAGKINSVLESGPLPDSAGSKSRPGRNNRRPRRS